MKIRSADVTHLSLQYIYMEGSGLWCGTKLDLNPGLITMAYGHDNQKFLRGYTLADYDKILYNKRVMYL